MGKMLKDKTGVSPIIAIILMVAITVVLAATIYVWVSGFGGSGDQAPNLACNADSITGKVTVADADKGLTWDKLNISVTATGGWANVTIHGATATTDYVNVTAATSPGYITASGGTVDAGDYFQATGTYTKVDITLRYNPTNTLLGTWTIYG
ncbi:MAG: hypothetical protein DRN21_03510 [Thermoplasmata archaeon]|nr:MAG: hypothetical protein DRN21_03510 [Thermoplasmata archaeon]